MRGPRLLRRTALAFRRQASVAQAVALRRWFSTSQVSRARHLCPLRLLKHQPVLLWHLWGKAIHQKRKSRKLMRVILFAKKLAFCFRMKDLFFFCFFFLFCVFLCIFMRATKTEIQGVPYIT